MVDSPLPAVSVSIITYNQHDLIGRALDSVLEQRTDFPFEIIIGDDCSDDGTQDVIRAYQARHPDKIQLILHPRRYVGEVAGRTNNVTNLLNCRGKYIAMLDGDDWWTDPTKLQRQYDLLEARPELSLFLHDVTMEYDPDQPDIMQRFDRLSDRGGRVSSGTYTHRQLALRDQVIPHIGSAMFPAKYVRDLPDWFNDVIAADFALLLHVTTHGDLYYDDRVAGAYWISPRGFQSTHRSEIDSLHRELEDLRIYAKVYPDTIENAQQTRGKAMIYWHLFQQHRRAGRPWQALNGLVQTYLHDSTFCLKLLLGPIHRFGERVYNFRSRRSSKSSENSEAIRS